MPPVSKRQARLFRAAASGDVKLPGLSRAEASEYVSGYPTKDLPERVSTKKKEKKKPAPLPHPRKKK